MIPGNLLKSRMTLTRILRTNDGREQGREVTNFYGHLEEGRRTVSTVNGREVEASHTLFAGPDLTIEVDDRFYLGEPESGVKPRMFTVINVEKYRVPTSGVVHHIEVFVK